MVLDLVRLINASGDLRELIRTLTSYLRQWTGCSAVGVRLREGDEFPYFETAGFPERFVAAGTQLCPGVVAGDVARDSNTIVECVCRNVLAGRTDPTAPFFTERGSFCCNDTSALLAGSNVCNGEGYASVALLPLRTRNETFGLLQLNDHHKNCFPAERLRFLEDVADLVALGLSHRRACQLLDQNEGEYRQIVETADEGILSVDPEDRIEYVNARIAEVLGTTPSDLIGKGTADFLFPEDVEQFRQRTSRRSKGDKARYEARFRGAHGQEIWCLVSPRPRFDRDGKFLGTFVMLTDITDRRAAEMALRASEERYRSLFEHMLNGVSYCEMLFENGRATDFVFLAVNRAFEKLTGLSNVTGKRVSEVIPGIRERDPDLLTLYGRVASTGVPENRETYVASLGTWLSLSVFSPADNHVVAVFDVITERKRVEEEREKLRGQLIHAQKMESIGRLAGGVAHDFNNMLSVIIGHAELALERIPASDPGYDDLWNILSAGKRAATLTRQLLAFARQQTIQPKVLDLNGLVNGLVKMLRRLIGENIELEWLPQPGLWYVRADPAQIDQILANLAVNAKDAIPGTGTIKLETANRVLTEADCRDIEGSRPGEFVRLTMVDTGCGMSKETRSRIFEPFFTTKPVGQGTGLGLATVYGAVQQNNGFLTVESEPDKGARFDIYLPRSASTMTTTAELEAVDEPPSGRETILIVEDQEDVLRMVSSMLIQRGYEVLAVSTPLEAIGTALEHAGRIDLVITDLIMPQMNGTELFRKVAEKRPGLKCLYMSGYAVDLIAGERLFEPGMNLIQKPFSTKAFAQAVRDAIDG